MATLPAAGHSEVVPSVVAPCHREVQSRGGEGVGTTPWRRRLENRNGSLHMHRNQDAFGRMILDYFNRGEGHEVVERDDGYVDVSGGPAAYFAEYPDWPPHQKKAMSYVRDRVLDVGCGAGRCCLYLQQKGHDVLGVDTSPLAVKVCRLRGVKHARVASITQFKSPSGAFDTILMMGNNFGLFGNFKRARWLLRRFRTLTSPKGRIVAETLDPYQTKDSMHLAYHRFNRRRGRMSGQIRLRVRYRNYSTPWFDYLIVSREEMKTIVKGTGWAIKRFIKSKTPSYAALLVKE